MKIAFWQTAFLGDAVLSLPTLQRLRAAFPSADIHLWVRAGLEALFEGQPCVDRVFGVAKRGKAGGAGGLLAILEDIREAAPLETDGYDLWISAHASLRSALISRLSGAGRRIGYAGPWFNRLAYTDLVDRRFTELDEVERIGRLLAPLGLEDGLPWPEWRPTPEAAREADRFFADHGMESGTTVVGLHPGSVWPTKRWPEDHFARLAALLAERGVTPVVFGAPGAESELAARVVTLSGAAGVINAAGALSLPGLAAVIGRLACYVGNDSGPTHLAWIQRVPTVAFFGPTVRRLGFFPRGESTRVLEIDLACRPCGLHGGTACPEGGHACMTGIAPETALAAVLELTQGAQGEKSRWPDA